MAVTTLTTSGADDTEMQAIVGYDLALGRNATLPEVKAQLIKVWTAYCRGVRQQMNQAALAPPAPIAPT